MLIICLLYWLHHSCQPNFHTLPLESFQCTVNRPVVFLHVWFTWVSCRSDSNVPGKTSAIWIYFCVMSIYLCMFNVHTLITVMTQGIYTSDKFSKSRNYCYNYSRYSGIKFMLVCQVWIRWCLLLLHALLDIFSLCINFHLMAVFWVNLVPDFQNILRQS